MEPSLFLILHLYRYGELEQGRNHQKSVYGCKLRKCSPEKVTIAKQFLLASLWWDDNLKILKCGRFGKKCSWHRILLEKSKRYTNSKTTRNYWSFQVPGTIIIDASLAILQNRPKPVGSEWLNGLPLYRDLRWSLARSFCHSHWAQRWLHVHQLGLQNPHWTESPGEVTPFSIHNGPG